MNLLEKSKYTHNKLICIRQGRLFSGNSIVNIFSRILWYEMITGTVPFYHSNISTFIYCHCSGFNCKLKLNIIPKEIMVIAMFRWAVVSQYVHTQEPLLACISRNSDYRINCNDLTPVLINLEKISKVLEYRVKKNVNRLSAHL